MRSLTTVILAMWGICAMGLLSAYAEDTANAVVITAVGLPVMADPDPISVTPSLVAPPDLLSYVEEQYAGDLIAEVNAAAAKFPRVPIELGWEMIRRESGFHHLKPNGKIKRGDSGEYGICQVLKDGMAIKKRHNLLDRADNICCMFEMMDYALFERGYSVERALGWYNTGSPVINRYARDVAKGYWSWVRKEGGTPS